MFLKEKKIQRIAKTSICRTPVEQTSNRIYDVRKWNVSRRSIIARSCACSMQSMKLKTPIVSFVLKLTTATWNLRNKQWESVLISGGNMKTHRAIYTWFIILKKNKDLIIIHLFAQTVHVVTRVVSRLNWTTYIIYNDDTQVQRDWLTTK